MIFAYTGDIHLSRYGQDKIEDTTNLPERLHSIKNVLYEIANYCIENDIKDLFIGGDILHGKSVIHAVAQDIMLDFFKDFEGKIFFHVIDGNHDLSGKGDSVVSALKTLRSVSNVRWIGFTETYRIEEDDILFVPYSYNLPRIVNDNKAKILISHFGLNEGMLNSGLSIISDISMKQLTGSYELVLLGHYHKPQEIINPNISLYYVGSPIQLDWGEKGDEKRFLVVDSNTMNVQSIPITQYKKHIELELTAENKTDILKLAKQSKDNGDHVKVIMKEAVDLTDVSGEFNVIDKTDQDITDRGITSTMSEMDKMERYMEIKKIPVDQWDKYKLAATEIIDGCEV